MPVAREIARSLGGYLKAQVQNALIVLILYIAAFAATDVPWWLVTGFVCGTINLVPHIGPLIALGAALFVKWCESPETMPLVYVAGAWLVIQIVDGFVLSPRAAGRAGVNPFVSILITLAAGLFLGPIGMLLAPVLAVASIVLRAARRKPGQG